MQAGEAGENTKRGDGGGREGRPIAHKNTLGVEWGKTVVPSFPYMIIS